MLLTSLKSFWELSSGKSRAALTGQGHEWGDVRRVQEPGVPECDLGSWAGSRRCAHTACHVLLADGVFCPAASKAVQPSKILSMGPEESSSYRG